MKVSTNNAEHYFWGELCEGWHLVRHDSVSVIQERMPPGTSEVKHYHERARQFFFILSGYAKLEVDGDEVALGPREGLEIPPQTPHRIRNDSEEDLELLVISHPMSHGDRIAAPG